MHTTHPKPWTVINAPDECGRCGWHQAELGSFVTGEDVGVGVGRHAWNDAYQNVLGPSNRHNRLEPVDVVRAVDNDEADAVVDRHRDLLSGLGVAMEHDECRMDASLERGQDLTTTSDVEPEPFLHHDPLNNMPSASVALPGGKRSSNWLM